MSKGSSISEGRAACGQQIMEKVEWKQVTILELVGEQSLPRSLSICWAIIVC